MADSMKCHICEGQTNFASGEIVGVCDEHMASFKAGRRKPRDKITNTCNQIREMLLAKNESYGNSALEPLRVFSKASSVEQLRVRLDDKLSRLMKGNAYNEDTLLDLIGYLILLYIAEGEPKQGFADEVAEKMAER